MGTYYEAVEDDARTNFQWDGTGGTGRAFYYTAPGLSAAGVQAVIREILGYTNPFFSLNRPGLNRYLPVTHPLCPYLYATRISSFVGKGTGTASRVTPVLPANPVIGSKPIADYLLYNSYEIGVEFASRPYPVLADDAFTRSVSGSWVKKDGNPDDFTYSPEFVRFCDWDYTPQDNTVQGQQGMFSLWGIPKVPPSTEGVPFQNPPWMWLPDQLLTIRWYGVPYRYITSSNSYIAGTATRNWRGRVNQNNFWNWRAGELLYLSYSVQKYTPPWNDIGSYSAYLPSGSQESTPATFNATATGTVVHYERLCDITLTFLRTTRYRSGSLGADIQNRNYVAAGHNLMPYLPDGTYRYATRTPLNPTTGALGTASVQNPPAWFSFPAEVLFTDPDASGGPSTDGDN